MEQVEVAQVITWRSVHLTGYPHVSRNSSSFNHSQRWESIGEIRWYLSLPGPLGPAHARTARAFTPCHHCSGPRPPPRLRSSLRVMELQQPTRPATSRQNTWAALCFQGFRPSATFVLPKDPPYLLPLPGLRRTPRTPGKEKTPPSLPRWGWPLPEPVRRLLRVPPPPPLQRPPQASLLPSCLAPEKTFRAERAQRHRSPACPSLPGRQPSPQRTEA